jgi:hypothetical protein
MSVNKKILEFMQIKEVLFPVEVGITAVRQNKYAGNYIQMPAFEQKDGQALHQS